jgi:hypothetical protein
MIAAHLFQCRVHLDFSPATRGVAICSMWRRRALLKGIHCSGAARSAGPAPPARSSSPAKRAAALFQRTIITLLLLERQESAHQVATDHNTFAVIDDTSPASLAATGPRLRQYAARAHRRTDRAGSQASQAKRSGEQTRVEAAATHEVAVIDESVQAACRRAPVRPVTWGRRRVRRAQGQSEQGPQSGAAPMPLGGVLMCNE